MMVFKIQKFYTFLARLTKKEKIIFYLAVILVSLTLLDRLIISPVFSKIRLLNKEIQVKETNIKVNLRILAQKDKILAESAKYKPFLGDPKNNPDEQVTSVLKDIESLANKSSVYLVDMKPGSVKEFGSSKKILINLNCEAQMEQLVDFMYNIENSDNLLSIEKYQLTPKSKESSVAKCSLSVYKVVAL
jgi:hypothetical protein